VDLTLELHERGGGGEGDPMLPRAGLGDELFLPHRLGQQGLPEAVIDLV
jgi:hypothetical protein